MLRKNKGFILLHCLMIFMVFILVFQIKMQKLIRHNQMRIKMKFIAEMIDFEENLIMTITDNHVMEYDMEFSYNQCTATVSRTEWIVISHILCHIEYYIELELDFDNYIINMQVYRE